MARKRVYPFEEVRTCYQCKAKITVAICSYFDKTQRRFYCSGPECQKAEKEFRRRHYGKKAKSRAYNETFWVRNYPPKAEKKSQPPAAALSVQLASDYETALRRHWGLAPKN